MKKPTKNTAQPKSPSNRSSATTKSRRRREASRKDRNKASQVANNRSNTQTYTLKKGELEGKVFKAANVRVLMKWKDGVTNAGEIVVDVTVRRDLPEGETFDDQKNGAAGNS